MSYRSLDEITAGHIAAAGIPGGEAEALHGQLRRILSDHGGSAPEAWKSISRRLLRPDQPFAFHQMMYYGCYKDYPSDTPPAWFPDKESATLTNIGQLLERRGKALLGSRYKDPVLSFSDLQGFSVSNPEDFWKTIFEELCISFSVSPSCILREHTSFPGGQWLPGAYINSAGSCLKLNDKRGPADTVVMWRDEGYDTQPVHRMTLKELTSEICCAVNALDTLGLEKESAIAIDMPMTVNSVVVYLAIILAGYVVVSIADSFSPSEIAMRLKISNARAIFTQDYILRGNKELPLYRRVVDAHSPLAIVIPSKDSTTVDGLRAGDLSWHDFLRRAKYTSLYVHALFLLIVFAALNVLIFFILMAEIFVIVFPSM